MSSINTNLPNLPLPKIDFTWSPVGGALAFNVGGNSYPPSGDSRYAAFYTPINTVVTFVAVVLEAVPDAPIIQFRWDMGDGVAKFGESVGHTYVVPNPSTSAYLEVTDSLNRKTYVSHVLLLQTQSGNVVSDHARVAS